MKVLITNAHLEEPAGTQVVVRDLAGEFRRQGHLPLVYSPRLGAMAEQIRGQGVEVTDRLDKLSAVPDIIHGQHHPQVVEALLHFPSTPAVYVCHAATAEVEEPFPFPRILRYVAVDERCRRRVESVPGIPAERIRVIENAVDLARFRPRGPLPERPCRALVFSNQARASTHLPAVRRACRQRGLQLDVLGFHAGTPVADPESVLPAYDLVFAKARCALEAMAVGAAVVLCDAAGAGPLVTSENFDRLRPMNFGAGLLTHPLRPEYLLAELEHYDPQDAAAVSRRVRGEAGLAAAAARWLALYHEVLKEFASSRQDVAAEFRALEDYLAKWSYGKRVEWEKQQLRRLEGKPLVGRPLSRLARRFLRRWTGDYGLK